jgi:hypothetical protein
VEQAVPQNNEGYHVEPVSAILHLGNILFIEGASATEQVVPQNVEGECSTTSDSIGSS